jgi:3-hydroxybutyryl-CoA dehydrogenase
MTIAIIGNDIVFKEAQSKLGHGHQYVTGEAFHPALVSQPIDVVFDFNWEWSEEEKLAYSNIGVPIFLNTVFSTLSASKIKTKGPVFGFCGLPTFFDRSQIEVVAEPGNKARLEVIMKSLNLDFTMVKDQIGMVTPRVIAMIINEAYEALQQGVASREDIDLSMKLGTNYPFGPFEWGDKIGMDHIGRLLTQLDQPLAF